MTGTGFLIFIYILKTLLTILFLKIICVCKNVLYSYSSLLLTTIKSSSPAKCFTNYIFKPNLNDRAAACEMLVLTINLIWRRNYFYFLFELY